MVKLNEFRENILFEQEKSKNKSNLTPQQKDFEDRMKRYGRVRSRFETLSLFNKEITNLEKLLSINTFEEIKKNLIYHLRKNGRLTFFLYAPSIISKINSQGVKEYRFSRIRSSRNFSLGPHSNIDETIRRSFSNFWAVAEYLSEQGSG